MSSSISLRKAIDLDYSKKSFESNISLLITLSRKKCVVIVEGAFDKKIFTNFFRGIVYLIPCNGRGYVEKVINRIPKSIVSIIGIADRDYFFNESNDMRLFYCDYNNIEMMIFSNDDIFANQISFSSTLTKSDLTKKRDDSIEKVFPLSIFRLTKSKLIDGDIIGVEDVMTSVLEFKDLDRNASVTKIINSINNCAKPSINQSFKSVFVSNYNNELCIMHNCYDITQGHDFTEMFCELIANNEYDIRMAAEKEFKYNLFKKTALYKDIKK